MKNLSFLPIVLSAGKGTRMKSSLPKTLHKVGGLPMIDHIYHTLIACGSAEPCLVTSPEMDMVRETSLFKVHAIQEKPLGTGHAALAAETVIQGAKGPILVLCGDTPLIEKDTIWNMLEASKKYDLVVLGMHVYEENSYGRIFLDEAGQVKEIIEAHECEGNLSSDLCNSGIILINHPHALPLLKHIKNDNKKKEYYLTDVVHLARKKGLRIGFVEVDQEEVLGVNTQQDLADAEFIFQEQKRAIFLDAGVSMVDPATVYFSYDTKIEPGVSIEPHVILAPGVDIREGAVIRSFSHIEGAIIKESAVVGPFARLRPGTVVGESARIGNFVEAKNTDLGSGSKVSHLTYVGDTEVGAGANIGAGTITCNYDGKNKYKTKIGEKAFIGSNTALVAPVEIGEGALVAAGSVITENVPSFDLAITRSPQKNIRGGAKKFLSSKEKESRK